MNLVELRQLEYFTAVAELGSFTKAAARVNVGQSAVSVAVRALERELGTPLFERTTHRVELTDAGAALLPAARRTLEAASEAVDAVAAVRKVVRGTLRIGTMQSLNAVDVAAWLGEFHARHPDVEIRMSPALGGSAALAEQVRRGETDLAFVALPDRDPPGLDVDVLLSEPLYLVAAPALLPARRGSRAPVTLAEVASLPFVDFPVGWGTRTVIDRAFAAAALSRVPRIEVADTSSFVSVVAAGIAVGFLPRSMLPPGPAVRSCPVHPEFGWDVMLVRSSDRRLPAAASAFVDLVLAR